MKILNGHSSVGGNRKLWGDSHDITAVEIKKEIADIYKDFFPNDEVIIGDLHNHLLNNYHKYGFIWLSPPCPDNSRARYWSSKNSDKVQTKYPDLTLYQYKIFLDKYYNGKYVIENVIPYYEPLIKPTIKIGRHYFWTNFYIDNTTYKEANIKEGNIKEWQKLHGIDISKYKLKTRKDQVLRNCVHPETGLHFLNRALEIQTQSDITEPKLF